MISSGPVDMISVHNTTKFYGSHCAVRDLSFTIAKGECVGFLGLNGAGKSTTLRLLSCLLLPTSGKVTIAGFDVEEQSHEIRALIGYLPEIPPLYGEMTVREYLRFAGRLRRMEPDRLASRLDAVVSRCGLARVVDAPIQSLSHGFKQRVGIAQAIIHEPALLILDEPMLGLDPVQVVELRAMIQGLRGEHTILLSTHMLGEIEATCDRILMMHEGSIAAQGTEAHLAQRYGGGGCLEFLVAGEVDAVCRALSSLSETAAAEVVSSQEGLVRVRLETDGDCRAEASRAVVGAGLDLLEMRRIASGLESVFLRLSESGGALVSTPTAKAEAQA